MLLVTLLYSIAHLDGLKTFTDEKQSSVVMTLLCFCYNTTNRAVFLDVKLLTNSAIVGVRDLDCDISS